MDRDRRPTAYNYYTTGIIQLINLLKPTGYLMHHQFNIQQLYALPAPLAARSKTWVFGRSPAEIVDSNPAGGMDVCLFWVLCVVR